MNNIDDYQQQLVAELIAQSARIDILVVKSRQAESVLSLTENEELETLRANQRETTKKLHELEAQGGHTWEGIGNGG